MDPVRWPSRLEWPLLALACVAAAFASHAFITPGMIGWLNDDSLYAIYARALASGLGYVDTSQIGNPPAPRFPIGFPALLVPVIAGAGSLAEQIARLQWVSPVAMALYVGLSYVYFRRFAGLSAAIAAMIAFLLFVHPDTDKMAALLLSDLVFAAVGLLAVMGVEAGLKRPVTAWPYWLGLGLLAGAGCLIRYAGFALVGAIALVLLWEKRFKPAAAGAIGVALAFGPWLAFRLTAGGEGYHEWLSSSTSAGGSPVGQFLGMSASMLMTNVLPGFLAPSFFEARHWGTFLAGTLLTAVTLLGAVSWLARPRPHETRLPAAYGIAMVALVLVWMVQFVLTWNEAMARLLIPVAPFFFLAFGRGLAELARLRREGPPAWAARAVVAGLALLCLLAGYDYGVRLKWALSNPYGPLIAEYQRLFAFLREKTPETARLMSMTSPQLHLYTGRKTAFLEFRGTNFDALRTIAGTRTDYLVGMPFHLYVPSASGGMEKTDVMQALVGDLIEAYPALLQPVYFGGTGDIAVFRVDQRALAEALAQPN